MAMPAARVRLTLEQLHALPDDGNRYELIDGELRTHRPSAEAAALRA